VLYNAVPEVLTAETMQDLLEQIPFNLAYRSIDVYGGKSATRLL
jgi:hypothetical protein